MLPVRSMGEGALCTARAKSEAAATEVLELGWESQSSPGQQAQLLVHLLQAGFAGEPGSGPHASQGTLPNSEEVSSSSVSNAVCPALVPSQPTFATATLSPQSRNSWGAGPAIWLRLPLYGSDFQNALGSSCSLVLGQAQMGLLSLAGRKGDADIIGISVIVTMMVAFTAVMTPACMPGHYRFKLLPVTAMSCRGYERSLCGLG